MNKVERVRAALADRNVDRVPASFWFHFPRAQAHGAASVRAHLDYYAASGVDYLKIMNEHPYRANVEIRAPSDWRKVRPAPLSAPFYQAQLDEIKRITDALGGECLAITTLFGPFASGNHASDSAVTEHLHADAGAVSQGLAAVAESLAAFAGACVDSGASGIYYAAQGGERDRFSSEMFVEHIRPHDLTVLEAIVGHGEFHLLHICGEGMRLEDYADYPAHAVNWAVDKGNLGLEEGRALFGRTVVGGMDSRGVMVDGTADEIQAAVQAIIADFGTRGLILGADCTFPTDIDVDHIRIAVEATAL